MDYKILPCGDTAVTVEFSRSISPEASARVMSLAAYLEKKKVRGICDIIPAYSSVTVCYDPLILDNARLYALIEKYCKKSAGKAPSGKTFLIPVCYGGKYGEDLPFVAKHAGLTEREVVFRHIGTDYLINMIGFLPGFPYLSGLDEKISAPRLEKPRTVIPAGSVGIGGVQTGIYPVASPGGWRLIGRTPVRVYDMRRENPVVYRAGDKIRFYPITEAEYEKLYDAAERGDCEIEIVG